MFRVNATRYVQSAVVRQAALKPVQQARTIYGPLYSICKSIIPKISKTEQAALESGTIGFDRELFSGKPSLQSLMKYEAKLTPKEQSFMDNEVEKLCEMLDDYQIQLDQDLPPQAWEFLRKNKFMAMIIPEAWGGLGFSAHGHSQVVTKIASRSTAASICVAVPNSLGPGELLMQYGTEEQKKYYLPRLSNGTDVPCFGLTGPWSGSDAASMPDTGIVEERNGKLGIVLNFSKRYITLAPIATVVGLAFQLQDPNKLLGSVGEEGITVALLPRGHPGLELGPRHDVLSISFMNGTVKGTDVFIPMDFIIGGQKNAGYGWNMLMECLSEGRGISLPASAVANSKVSAISVGAYARIRKQFKVPVAELEGVQEKLANIAYHTYVSTAAQHLMNSIIMKHEKPSVLSAVMKGQITHRGRLVVNDAMDVIGGAGICKGPNNFLATAYQATPIAITVEGSNILTRSLIMFGQGLIRSHPHVLDVMKSVLSDKRDVLGFKKHLNLLAGHAITNTTRSLNLAVTRKRSGDDFAFYESQMQKIAANFAYSSDLAMTIGGQLKFKEMLSGRFADVLSNLYLGYATMWFYKTHYKPGSDALFALTMQHLIYDSQEALIGIADNFPIRPIGWAMKAVTFPFGRCYSAPSDTLITAASNAITTDTAVRELLKTNLFISKVAGNRQRQIENCFPLAMEADAILKACKRQKRTPTASEQSIIDQADALRDQIVQVDSFPALGREYWRTHFNVDKKVSDELHRKPQVGISGNPVPQVNSKPKVYKHKTTLNPSPSPSVDVNEKKVAVAV